jgi:hypothetical protein
MRCVAAACEARQSHSSVCAPHVCWRSSLPCLFDQLHPAQVWEASDKREYGARTIRTKIHKHLPTFLEEYPELPELKAWEGKAPAIDWKGVIVRVVEAGARLFDPLDRLVSANDM